MAALQRSSISFRRQGSSGLVWDRDDDKRFSVELSQPINQKDQENPPESTTSINSAASQDSGNAVKPQEEELKTEQLVVKVQRSRSNGGGRGFRTGKVAPALEPPSPKVSACGCSSGLRKRGMGQKRIKNNKPKIWGLF